MPHPWIFSATRTANSIAKTSPPKRSRRKSACTGIRRAVLATVPQSVYRKLARLGLIMLGPARLTDKGRAVLGDSTQAIESKEK